MRVKFRQPIKFQNWKKGYKLILLLENKEGYLITENAFRILKPAIESLIDVDELIKGNSYNKEDFLNFIYDLERNNILLIERD